MKSEIEKYIWYYLSVYIIVLMLFGFFQYISICNTESLNCKFDDGTIVNILTVTAYILTPIVAIIGFISWKTQFNKQLATNYFAEVINAMRDFHQNIDPIYKELILLRSKLEMYSDVLGFKNAIPDKLNNPEVQSDLTQQFENFDSSHFFDTDFDLLRKKVNYIETLLSELLVEEHFIKPDLLDFPSYSLMIINIIEAIAKEKNAKDFKKTYSLITKENQHVFLSNYRKGFVLVKTKKNICEDIVAIQHIYINLIKELKKNMNA